MKRVVISGLIAIALGALGLAGAAPSGATTTCHIMDPQAGTAIRYCGIDTAIVGAQFRGGVTWAFANSNTGPHGPSSGQISGTVYDTSDDGSCAIVKINHLTNGNQDWTHSFQACGKGKFLNFAYGINGDESLHFRGGTWKVNLKTASLTTLLWKQSVTQNYP
ncbi:MAG: hypothetical protein ACR2KJ_01535 [Jatrophihabitans sp.]